MGFCGCSGISRIRYDTRCYFNVRSKADISQLNLPYANNLHLAPDRQPHQHLGIWMFLIMCENFMVSIITFALF